MQRAKLQVQTLWIMAIIALVGLALVVSYTVIVYWTFGRVSVGQDD